MEQQILIATDAVAPNVEFVGNPAWNTLKLPQHARKEVAVII